MFYTLPVFLISLALAASLSTPYTHHAILDNIQAQTNSTAWGAAVVSFSRQTGLLSYYLVNNVQGTTVAHIHGPALVLQNAGPIVTIPGFSGGANSSVSGTVQIPAANYDDIDNGRAYFNIHTNTWPDGEIRGQILAINQQITSLNGAQDSVATTATGVAWTKFNPANGNLTLVLNHNVVNATLAHIHGPAAPGVSAAPIVTIAGNAAAASATPISFSAVLTADQISWLNAGLLYYNVHSNLYPNGEIRGQINPIVNYLGALDGQQDNQTTTSLGAGFAALYQTSLWSAIYHSVANPTAAHIHTAIPGVAGPITFPYANVSANPISQNFTATQAQVTFFVNGTDYFNVHTSAAPDGLIRGQIYAKLATPTPSPTTSSTTGGVSTTGNLTTGTSTGATSTSSASSLFAGAACILALFPLFI